MIISSEFSNWSSGLSRSFMGSPITQRDISSGSSDILWTHSLPRSSLRSTPSKANLVASSKLGGEHALHSHGRRRGTLYEGLPSCCWRGSGFIVFSEWVPNNRWFIQTKYPSLYRLRPEGNSLRDLETLTQPAKWCWRSRSTKAHQEFAFNRNNTTSTFMVGILWTDNYIIPATPCFPSVTSAWNVVQKLLGASNQFLSRIIQPTLIPTNQSGFKLD